MNPYAFTVSAIAVALAPFVLGMVTASWRQRRRLAQRSRTLTIDLGPKVLLGFALSTTAATPALASGTSAATSPTPSLQLPALDRIATLPPAVHPTRDMPSRPTIPRNHETLPATTKAVERTHLVRSGESLWSITRNYLGQDASNAQVARAWPSLWAANRAVVGADPSLVFPGQRLTIPATLGVDS
jgi:nucleoid-associated protein YgaU